MCNHNYVSHYYLMSSSLCLQLAFSYVMMRTLPALRCAKIPRNSRVQLMLDKQETEGISTIYELHVLMCTNYGMALYLSLGARLAVLLLSKCDYSRTKTILLSAQDKEIPCKWKCKLLDLGSYHILHPT